jgi:septum site-determining protein MinD
VLDILAIDLIGVIPEDERILVASNQGLPLVMHGLNGSSAGQAFRNVALRLEGQAVPFMDLTVKQGFMTRLRTLVSGN